MYTFFGGSGGLIVCRGMPAYIAYRPISYLGLLIIHTDYKRPDNHCSRHVTPEKVIFGM